MNSEEALEMIGGMKEAVLGHVSDKVSLYDSVRELKNLMSSNDNSRALGDRELQHYR